PSSLAPESLGPTITVGEILVEIMATTIGKGFLDAQPLIGPFPSGAPAIFIDQVAKLGGQAGIIAAVGNDDFGRLNVERLRRDGADVSAIAVSPDYPTGSAFVRYADDGTRDFVYNIARSAAGNI
ncbi:PfkB family carbohydrate kinase, partial [Escherichia coli]|nr:PfkB family carbohydrate kinase [Escherichia coli]